MANEKYYLFIGRWSPFHSGHKYIIDSFVDNGKLVCIAVRASKEKYPVHIRKKMIERCYAKEIEEKRVTVIVIPDIEGVCVGRKVGYSIIEVPEKIKKISGTKIRQGKSDALPEGTKEVIKEYEEL